MRQQDKGRNKADVIADRVREINAEIDITPVNCDVIYEYGSGNYRNFDLVLMTVDKGDLPHVLE
jgi:tRNA A37 threonylcarbamoyladenosine dehydratase